MIKNQPKKPVKGQKVKSKQVKHETSESLWQILMPLLVILPVVFFVFYPSLDNEFTNWDDPDLIIDNPLIRDLSWESVKKIFTTFYFGNYQPLHLVSYSIEYHYWKLDPTGYHAVSLAFFLLTTAAVYYLLYILGNKNKLLAITGTLLFALNAMRVESVAWAAERKDTLYALFYVLSLIAYTKYVIQVSAEQRYKWSLLLYAFMFFTLSVFSKVMAVSIVGAMIMIDYFYQRKIDTKLILEKIPFVILSIIIGVIQVKATASSGSIDTSDQFTFTDRIFIVCRNLMFYVYKMLVPVNLSAFYPYPPKAANIPWPTEFYIAPVFVLVVLAFVIWSTRHTRVVMFAAGIYFASLALVLQYVAVGPAMFNERYSLIPAIPLSFALASLLVYLVNKFPSLKQVFIGIMAIYVLSMSYLTYKRCDVWQTSLTLWNDVLDQFPNVATALNNRGKYYGKDLGSQFAATDKAKYEAYLDSALIDLTASIKNDPAYEKAYSNRGIVYSIRGEFDKAVADYDAAIKLKPDYYEAITNRAIALAQSGKTQLALEGFTKALAIEQNADTYKNRGICYSQIGQYDKALADYNQGIMLNPNLPELYLRRSEAYFKTGRFREALSDVTLAKNSGFPVPEDYFKQLQSAAQ